MSFTFILAVVFCFFSFTLAHVASDATFLEAERLNKHSADFWKARELALDQICGNSWQTNYSNFHAAHRSDPTALLLILVDLHPKGFSDRITGIVSALYWAMLTRRVFFIETESGPVFSSAFQSRWIQTSSPTDVGPYEAASFAFRGQAARWKDEHFMWQERIDYFRKLNASLAFFADAHIRTDEIFLRQNLRETYADSRRLYFSSNRGRSYGLVASNPFHSQELQDMGLTPRNAFLCGFDFLFQPKPHVVALSSSLIGKMMEHEIRIAIGIRVGDHAFGGAHQFDIHNFESYFRCAEQIEAEAKAAAPNSRAVWLVRTESESLKFQAKEKYQQQGRSILYDLEEALHPVFLSDMKKRQNALDTFAALTFAFSAADHFVITQDSGFTLQSAWISPTLNPDIYTHDCQKRSLADWASDWSGI